MCRQISFLLIAFVFFTLVGCDRTPSSEAHYRVLEMLKNNQYDLALNNVNRRLEKAPADRSLLEDRLILLLANDKPQAREEILRTQVRLDAIGDGRRLLLEQAKNRLSHVRKQTAFALGALRDPRGLPVLKELAEDRDSEVRAEAIHSLAKINHPDTKNLLLIHLRDGYWKVRAECADALAKLNDPSATKQLFRAADDSDDYVRMQIFNAILAVANPSQLSIYLKEMESDTLAKKTAAALAMGKINRREAVPHLIELLKDKKTPERLQIAQCLISLSPDLNQLESLLKTERNPPIRKLLLNELRKLDPQPAVIPQL